jgi:hypothetical protein
MSKNPISTTYETPVQNIANRKNAKLVIKSMLTSKKISLPAFLTSFSQTFTSNWNEEEVYGRMDPIATFQNTRRSVSLAFDLPAANLGVAQDNLKQCDRLAQFLYPGYVNQNEINKDPQSQTKVLGRVIARPPLVSVKFANLISSGKSDAASAENEGLLGYLSGLEWAPALDMGMFTDNTNNLFPKVISLSFTLNVLHQGDKGLKEGNEWASNTFFGGYE